MNAAIDHDMQVISTWLTRHFGGEVTSIERQPRWRPNWFADVEVNGEVIPVCIRGTRTDTELNFPLDHEMRFQHVVQDAGLPVARVHGWIDEIPAYVMDRMPGRPDFAGVAEEDRAVVVDEYIQVIARLHAIPIERFVEAGIERATRPEESAVFGMGRMEEIYRRQKRHPDPFLEWSIGWTHRHPSQSKGREAGIVWDSGQFHHDGTHFVSLMDLELGHIGDPMMDLAALRMRDSVIPFGDFNEFYARYGEITGVEPDLEAIELHHIAFTLSNLLAFSHTLRDDVEGSDFATNLQWCNETNIYATEAIADYLGIELPDIEFPEPAPSRHRVASTHLARTLRGVAADDPVVRYRLRGAFRVAQHLARVHEIGDRIDEADLDDIAAVLGHRPADWPTGQEELERFVLADQAVGAHDQALVRLFHRLNLRAQLLNGPAGSAMARHNPIQRFPRRSS